MGRPPKRTSSPSNSSNHGHPPAKKMCHPLGTFSVLPLEIKEEILSLLPISSIATMATVSREWMKFTNHWLQSPRAARIILTNIKRLIVRLSLQRKEKSDEIKTLISLCSSLGVLIRAATQCSGAATRVLWVRRIMAELCLSWNSDDYILLGFGAYFNCCFRSSNSEELDKIMRIVFWKLRMKTYINTQLKHGPGKKKNHEVRTRLILRTVFSDYRLLVAAIKNLTEGRRNKAIAQAQISFVLYGPTFSRKLLEHIAWDYVSGAHVSASSMTPLAHFLNLSFWRKEPFDIKTVLKIILGAEKSPYWSTSGVAALFVTLDSDICIPYLLENSTCAQILVKIGLFSLKRMMNLSDQLRKALNAASFKTLRSKMLAAILEEIVSQKNTCDQTCGDCSDCTECPMEGLKKIQTTIKDLSLTIKDSSTQPPRKSKRLSRKL